MSSATGTTGGAARGAKTAASRALVDGGRLEALMAAAARDPGERELLAAATRSVADLLGEEGSCILLEGEAGGAGGAAIQGEARVVVSTRWPSGWDRPLELARYPEVVGALADNAVVAIEDVASDPRLATVRAALPPTLKSVVAVPLSIGERRLGALLVKSSARRRPSASEQATAALIGRLTAVLLDGRKERTGPESRPGVATAGVSPRGVRGSRVSRRILVVEDDGDNARTLAAVLMDEGYLVEVAENGAEGIRLAREMDPDLVLLDVNMPVMDGFTVAQELSRDARTRHVAILFISGVDDFVPRVRGIKMEEVDFLQKPYTLEELLARVERSLNQAGVLRRLRTEAHQDELTGLGNLRSFHDRLAIEQSRLERYGTPATMVAIDVDKLKQINDTYGHAVGSVALKAIGRVLGDEIRDTDLAVRYGGDEFVVLLPHTTLAEGIAFSERVLAQIRRLRPAGLSVTVSIGVASSDQRPGQPLEGLLQKADLAAYRSKRLGGDQVCGFEESLDGR